jgi:AcrR family transcriptional regulator
MGIEPSKKSGRRRPPLTKQRVLEAAVAFADENGVEALTMRKVADELGYGVMSLYNHVANKEDMLAGMVDVVTSEIALPSVEGEWRASVRKSAASAYDVLLVHHWAPAEWSVRMPGPARLRYMDALLEVLTNAGLSSDLVYSGYHAVTMHIVGFTLQQVGYQQSLAGGLEDVAGAFLADLPDDFPFLAAHVQAHLDGDEHGDEFGLVLDLILDGLHRSSCAP